ncbi:hypothetical protein JCM1841_001414 [Sporobolomyces salmonicolor]
MIDRMNRDPSHAASPASFPPRTSSRASSASRLSTQSSNRSLHSLHSLHSMASARPKSPLVGRASGEGADDEEETTPSMRQEEWGGRRAFSHTRSRTTSNNTHSPHRLYSDDASSIHSSRTGGEGDLTMGSFYTGALPPQSRSTPTSPRVRPHYGPPSSSTPPSNPYTPQGLSPLRLLPRSPLKERTPLEDLTFFREAGAFSDDDRWMPRSAENVANDSESIHSVASVGGGPGRSTSSRNARLREDIEKAAQRIKERASMEEMSRAAGSSEEAESSVSPHVQQPPARSSVTSVSSAPLYPPAPSLPPLSASLSDYHDSADARSLRSVASGSGSVPSVTGTWPPPSVASGSGSARGEYAAPGERSERPRQRESREWSQTCWVWAKEKGSSSSGGGKFSKAPLIRDVPSVMKRKSAKRESAHHLLSPAEAMMFSVDDSSVKSSKSSSSKDKGKVPIGPSVGGKDGGWRRATGVLRDDGYFRVFSDSDKIILHSVYLPSYARTDVRPVDHSLFGRPNCVSISHRSNSPSTPSRSSFAASSSSHPPSSTSSLRANLDEPLYLCFPSVVATQVWLVMTHCFARPEYYLASGAATPRPVRTARKPGAAWPSDDGTESDEAKPDELEKSCRIYRSLFLTINEGRGLGDLTTEVVRPGAKASWERPTLGWESSSSLTADSNGGGAEAYSLPAMDSPNKAGSAASSLPMPKLQTRPSEGGKDKDEVGGVESYCEIEIGGEVVARTALRRGVSPFWNEAFTFSDLPPFTLPITIRVLQATKHSSRPHVLGTTTVRVPDLPRHELVEDWWSIKPTTQARSTDVIGELSLSMRIGEEVVLPSREYETMLKLLTDDVDADLATDIAHEFPSDLEDVTKILLRIYQAESQLVTRLLRFADLEVDDNNRQNRSSAILFRGNTILTKSVELYLRLIGAEYLEASIGEPIRRICKEKVEIEIDPMRLKSGWKEKELQANIHALHEWTLTVWNSIYAAREKCPQDLRQIFGHIQRIVVEKYGQGEDQKNTRWTSVSAFIFLRFFVPAVLNPKLFFIVSSPPDTKSQRTLTLVAKTLQGLANFSSFGQKEPWMLPMNPFVQDNTSAFVDFIEHVSTPAPSTAYRQEWTSPLASTYLAPYRLRNSLTPLAKEGVPLLPHLIDLPRELGLLALYISRGVTEKGPQDELAATFARSETPSIASSRGGRSHRFIELTETCIEVHEESRRRGGGLVSALSYYELRGQQANPKTRIGSKTSRMTGRPATANPPGGRERGKSLTVPSSRPSTASTTEELHIRNPVRPITPPPLTATGSLRESSEISGRNSTASRRSHRSFTINGTSPGRRGSFPPKSFSTEDLSLLASIQTGPTAAELLREGAGSPIPASATVRSFAAYLDSTAESGSDVEPPEAESSQANEDAFLDAYTGADADVEDEVLPGSSAAAEEAAQPYQFPRPCSSSTAAVQKSKSKASSTHSSSSTASRSTPRTHIPQAVPTSRIRITQETTTTTTYISDLPAAARTALSPATVLDDLASPAATEDCTPFESEFGGMPFTAPLVRTQISATSTKSAGSGWSLPSSASNMSISAEVSASGPGAAGRRASSAGLMSGFGMGRAPRVDEDGAEARSSGSGGSGKGGLLSRAMGRKGSRAS